MDTITIMFAFDVAAGSIGLVCIAGTINATIARRRFKRERDDALEALTNEQTEGAHFRELADNALANIENLQVEVDEANAAAGRWAWKYATVNAELRRIERERIEAAERRTAHMRSIAVIGNRSPKRRRNSAAA